MAFELDLRTPAGSAVDYGLVPAGAPNEVEELAGGVSASVMSCARRRWASRSCSRSR